LPARISAPHAPHVVWESKQTLEVIIDTKAPGSQNFYRLQARLTP